MELFLGGVFFPVIVLWMMVMAACFRNDR